jgi:two-component system, NarL family, nitrate/nitrite sensor histidine kinase NarX
LPSGTAELAPWQNQLLEALTRHIGIALGISRKTEQDRLLALQEERSIIARELHDSIAQSLSYLKIQASLLQPVLADPARRQEAETTLHDLRDGITEAYRQLRELLATFRLKMEGDFRTLLTSAVEEYACAAASTIRLEVSWPTAICRRTRKSTRCRSCARRSPTWSAMPGRQAWVTIRTWAAARSRSASKTTASASPPPATPTTTASIMRERAQGLQGRISITTGRKAAPGQLAHFNARRIRRVTKPLERHEPRQANRRSSLTTIPCSAAA